MINITIFSKDRACQLNLLLDSIKLMFKNYNKYIFNILYTYSNEEFQKGYDIVQKNHKDFNYIKENNFKLNTISLIQSVPYTMFMVDDNVFKETFDFNSFEFNWFQKDLSIFCLSLRMCPRINYCYTENILTKAPYFLDTGLWNWRESGLRGDWSYPMSIDGTIFRTNEIFPLIKELPYNNPNSFEAILAQYAAKYLNKSLILCYQESKLFNIPVNKVQIENNNRYGNISQKYLNDLFLKGKRISLKNIVGFKNISAHQEIELIYE